MDRVLTGRKTPTLKYEESPKHRTRSELMATRKALLKPSKTFDLDGDGDVDPLEHYIASMLDLDNNGSLDDEEKARAKELINALKKYYVVGLDVRACVVAGVAVLLSRRLMLLLVLLVAAGCCWLLLVAAGRC